MLDGLSLAGPANPESNTLLSRLRQKVRFDLAALQLETTPQTVLVPCVDRIPQDFSDFNPTVVDSLNGHRVLIEIWGQIDVRGAAIARAQLNYTLVPISFYDRPVVPPGGFAAVYEQRLRGGRDDLVKVFGEFSDLKAYVSVAAGLKSLKEHDYDQAFHCFCRAGALLGQNTTGIAPGVRTSLATYVNRKVAETFAQARADASAKSTLALDGNRPACPGVTP